MTHRLKRHRLFKHFFLAIFLLIVIACDNIGMNEQQMLQNAKAYLDKGELMAASIELRNTLQKNHENAEARFLLGSINLKIGDLTSAEKEFRQAALAGWNEEETNEGLARIFIARNEFQKLLDEIVIKNTWSPATRANISALRALAEASLGQTLQAKTTLAKGNEYKANAFQVLKTTAIFQLFGMLEGEASNTLKTALSLYPENPDLLLLHASSDIQNSNLTRAAETFRKIISLDPPKLITFNGRRAHIGLAHLLIIGKNYDEAITTLAPILKVNNKDPEANYLGGLLAFQQRDYHRAEGHMRTLLAIAPDNSPSQLLMGKIKYALKDFDQAAHHLSTYLNTKPDDIAVRKLLTNTYLMLNQPEKAKLTLQVALTANFEDTATLILLSQIEFNKGDMNAGIQALSKAIKSSPDNIELHKQLAKAYIATGETNRALNELKTFQRLSKNTKETQKLTISAHMQAGEVDKAINIANNMLAKNPKDPEVMSLNGSLYADSGNNQQARIHFNKALRLQDNLASAAAGLANIERKDGNLDKAIKLYNGLIESDNAGTMPMLALAEIAAQQNRTNDMISWLEKARNTAPAEIQARMILTEYYLQNAQPQKAEIYIKEALKQSPEQANIIALHGKVLIAQKRYNEALPLLKTLVAKLPESTVAQNLLGEAFLRQHKLGNARKHLHKALLIQQDNIIAISLLAETELKDGNFEKSLEYSKTLQKQQPENYIGHMLEGDAWMAKQNYNRAHHAYDNAWQRLQTAQLAKRLFLASKNTSSLQKAIGPLLTWLQNKPDDYLTRLYLATVYQSAKENDKAIKEYEKVLKQAPDNSTVLNNLAWLYSLNGNPKAMDMAESAYRFSPENPDILDTYGWLLIQQSQVEKGQRLIKQALDALPGNSDIRYHYAAALLKSGNVAEGKQILEELLKQDKPFGGREEAKQLLENL